MSTALLVMWLSSSGICVAKGAYDGKMWLLGIGLFILICGYAAEVAILAEAWGR